MDTQVPFSPQGEKADVGHLQRAPEGTGLLQLLQLLPLCSCTGRQLEGSQLEEAPVRETRGWPQPAAPLIIGGTALLFRAAETSTHFFCLFCFWSVSGSGLYLCVLCCRPLPQPRTNSSRVSHQTPQSHQLCCCRCEAPGRDAVSVKFWWLSWL